MRLLLVTLLALAPLAAQDNEPADRLRESAAVFTEIMEATDTSIPQDLLEKAHCAVIVPGLKTAAFGFGAKYGKGYLSCRNAGGNGWSAPGTVRIEGGSVGFQIGGSSTDLIMLVMSERGADKLLASKFTLGVEGSVAAGPVGRTATAQTDAQMKADILSWSRSQGLFAGVAIEGATLRQDLDDNATLYGKKIENREIVTSGMRPPEEAAALLALLNKHSVREGQGVSLAANTRSTNTKRVIANPSNEMAAANPRSATAPGKARNTSPSRANETPAAMSPEDVKTVQQSLNDKGFNAGPVDGLLGPRTRAGVRQFQESENLPVTGRLDAETAGRLGVGPESIAGEFRGARHDVAQGSKELGHEVKQGKPVAAGKEFGKGVSRAAQKVGDGVVKIVNPGSDRGDREEARRTPSTP